MRQFFTGVLLLGSILFAGCVKTGEFWDHKVVLASDLIPSAVDGQWEGSWQSYEFYDNGLIHMVITPADASPGVPSLPGLESPPEPGTTRYLARVTQWHYGIFAPEEFEMVLVGKARADGQIQFHGEHDLGPLNGMCKYDGFVDGRKSALTYVNRNDFGTVTLQRVVNAH